LTSSVSRRPAARGSLEVRVDVGAPEGVDRLLGVADEHERHAVAAERGAHDVPLHRVGVLELVDEHDPVALAQLGDRRRAARPAQGLVQPGEQVVVGHHARAALALLELAADRLREPHAHRGDRLLGRVARLDRRRRVGDRHPGDRGGLGAVDVRAAVAEEAPDVQVVDDLVDEVAEVLDERRVGLDVAGDPQPPSTSWQKPWVVAIVAASKSASARARRSRRATISSGVPVASSSTTSSRSLAGAPASARDSPCSHCTSRSRTRSRSSPVAMRVNVTRRI
jgi:hypothetical protein